MDDVLCPMFGVRAHKMPFATFSCSKDFRSCRSFKDVRLGPVRHGLDSPVVTHWLCMIDAGPYHKLNSPPAKPLL